MSWGEKEKLWLIVNVDCSADIPAVSLCQYQVDYRCGRQLQIGNWIKSAAVQKKNSFAYGLQRFTGSEKAAEALISICRSCQEQLEEFAGLQGLESLSLGELLGSENVIPEAAAISLTDLRKVYDSTAGAVLEDALKAVQKRIDAILQEEPEGSVLVCAANTKESANGFLVKLQLERFFGLSSRDERRITQKELKYRISEWENRREYYEQNFLTAIWRETDGAEFVKNFRVGESEVNEYGVEFDPRLSWELIVKISEDTQEYALRRLVERRGFLNWWQARSHWKYPNMTLYIKQERSGKIELRFLLEGLFEEETAEYELVLSPEEYLYPELA